MADDQGLLDTLLEYAIAMLEADHATFCEVQNSPEVITVVAAAGRLTDPEVLPGPPLVSDQFGYDGEDEEAGSAVGIYRRGDPATPGVTAFLERIGAAFDVTIRVYQDEVRTHLLEVYYLDDRPFAEREIQRAEQLAAMLTTVISRERLTQELEQAQTRFQTLVRQIPAIPYIVEAGTNVVFLASGMNQLLGRGEEDEVSFDDWIEALHPDDRERAVRSYETHVETGRAYDEEYRLVDHTGVVHWFHDRATLLPDAAGAPLRSHGVMFDVTERRAAEEALRRSEQARQEVLAAMLHSEAAARAQIAGELHDDTIQVMTAALMSVERVMLAAVDTDPRVAEALEGARATLQTAVERARRLTFELRPPLLDAQGIAAALRDLTAEVGVEGGFAVTLEAPRGPVLLHRRGPRLPNGQGGADECPQALACTHGGRSAVGGRHLAAGIGGRRRPRFRRDAGSRPQRHAPAPGPGRDARAAAAGRRRRQHRVGAGRGRSCRLRDPGRRPGRLTRGPSRAPDIITPR